MLAPRLAFLTLFIYASTGALSAADFTLYDNRAGVKPAPIIVFQNAPPLTRAAAVELADYIAKIGGVKPEIIDGEPPVAPERAVWIGVQPALKRLFPKVSFDFAQREEIVIVANEHHLVIAGRDKWDPAQVKARIGKSPVTGKQQEYGTANAVYTFLQDQLGVRWLWPGELGEDVVKRDRVVLAPLDYRFHPPMWARGGLLHYSALGNGGYGQSPDWARHQRLQLASMEMEGGHGFSDWWDKYHEKYPEIFALQPDGTRSGHPTPRTAKLCESNPKVWELWMNEVAEDLVKDPTRTIFNASPNDGWASGHCVCAKCTAWDNPAGEPREFHWLHKTETRPALSDRDVTFANVLAKMLQAKYPERGYRVMLLSYGHSRPAPVAARPAENVIISCVANFLGRTGLVDVGSTRGDTYRQQFDAWSKLAPNLFWRPNTGSPAGWQQGLPDLSTTQTIADLKAVAASHGRGIFIDAVWEHWATQGPQYYAMAQVTWNPEVDAAAVLADYYRRGFGLAAAPVREYYEALEQARMAFTEKTKSAAGVFSFPQLYTDELLRASQTRLDRAAALAGTDEKAARRVDFVQAGLTYTRLTMENIRFMSGYWKKKDEAVAAQVKKNWEEIEKLLADHPMALNARAVRPLTPRMAGLHPDFAPPKPKKGQLEDLDLK